MAESRRFQVLVLATGLDTDALEDAVVAYVEARRIAVDEIHLVAPLPAAHRALRTVLRSLNNAGRLAERCARLGIARRDVMFGARMTHPIGANSGTSEWTVANDALNAVRKICAEDCDDVSIVALPDAGAIGVACHAALHLVGRPQDKFYAVTYEVGSPSRSAAMPTARKRGHRASPRRKPPVLVEVPPILAERPVDKAQSYQELAGSRQLARRRLSEPRALVMHARRRTVQIDDTEIRIPRLRFFWAFAIAALAPQGLPLRVLNGNFRVEPDGRLTITNRSQERACVESVIARLRRIFVDLFPDAADDFALILSRACGSSPGLPSIVAKFNAELKRALGLGATPYLISGGRGADGYRFTLPLARLRLGPRMSALKEPK